MSKTILPSGEELQTTPEEVLRYLNPDGLRQLLRQERLRWNLKANKDADYYDNPDNEGHIMLPLVNHGENEVRIVKGMRVAQGIFYRYLVADGDAAGCGAGRNGGFGSTGDR